MEQPPSTALGHPYTPGILECTSGTWLWSYLTALEEPWSTLFNSCLLSSSFPIHTHPSNPFSGQVNTLYTLHHLSPLPENCSLFPQGEKPSGLAVPQVSEQMLQAQPFSPSCSSTLHTSPAHWDFIPRSAQRLWVPSGAFTSVCETPEHWQGKLPSPSWTLVTAVWRAAGTLAISTLSPSQTSTWQTPVQAEVFITGWYKTN